MNLPDLTAKVKVSTEGITEAEARLKELGESVRGSVEHIKEYLRLTEGGSAPGQDTFERARLNIARTAQEAENLRTRLDTAADAFVRFGQGGEVAAMRISSATARTKEDFQALEDRARTFAESVGKDFTGVTSAVIKLGEDGTASLSRVTAGLQSSQNQAATTGVTWAQLGATWAALGAFAIPALVAGIALLVAAILPLIILVVAATTVLATFTAGLMATVAALGIAFLALGGMAAGVVLLADRLFTTGKILSDPLLGIENNLKKMADTWGYAALPAALSIISTLNNMIPAITSAGLQILTWFGGVLPQVMKLASDATHALSDAFNQAWPVLAGFLGEMLARLPAFEKLWGPLLTAAVGAIQGILTQLLALSDWFTARLPAMAPIVGQIMDTIGRAFLGVADAVGKLSDYFVTNWPKITRAAADDLAVLLPILNSIITGAARAVDWFIQNWPEIRSSVISVYMAIKEGWDAVQPVLDLFKKSWQEMAPLFQFVRDHANELRPILIAVGAALGIVAASAMVLAIAGVLLIAVLETIFLVIGKVVVYLVGYFQRELKATGDQMSWLGSTVQGVIGAIGGAFSWLGSTVSGVLNWIGNQMSNLGSTANWVVGQIGSAFSWLGGTLSGILNWIGNQMSNLGSTASWLGGMVWGLADNFSGAFWRAESAVWSLISALGRVAGAVWDALSNIPNVGGAISYLQGLGRAEGGPVLAGSVYTVGERGPETLIMSHAGGGFVIPHANEGGAKGAGGPYQITINISGAGNPEAVAAAVDWRLSRLLTTI